MLQAKTIMIKDVATVRPQDTLDQVIEILVDKNITGIPVVNEDNTLAGIITERDILSYMLEQDAITHLTDSNLCEHTVYHAMTANVVAFDEITPLAEICECLVNRPFRRVPIIDKDRKLVGIISRKDLIAVIA
ncbi:MAG: CBS domain-containing protein [Phycisphaerae bacterium]|nr:CBS domain-containing protein [Phycisphaerae bacterium]